VFLVKFVLYVWVGKSWKEIIKGGGDMRKEIAMFLFFCSLFLFVSSLVYGQGDNSPDPNVNLALLDEATVSGSVPEGIARGKPEDILWDPVKQDFAYSSEYHEYGIPFGDKLFATKDNPFYWMVEWQTPKNINYITIGGAYENQPQPNTPWAIQYWDSENEKWIDVPKAHNGWEADTLNGVGGWINNGVFQWRGLEPIVTTKLRIIAYCDTTDEFVDNDTLKSIHFRGTNGEVKSVLIQYLDFSNAEPDNEKDEMVNLGLLPEAVVSAAFKAGEYEYIRGQPATILFDPVKGDFYEITAWGEFGYPFEFDAGYPTEEDPFYWMVEWPVPKYVNYFTWGGVYGNQPQPYTLWAVQYWDGEEWVTVMDGVGGSKAEGRPGVDTDAESVWQSETPIVTTKFRLAVWSDGINPLVSFHIRGRGGHTWNWDERDYPFKAVLLQYRELTKIADEKINDRPRGFSLRQNYPNPFNPITEIAFTVPKNEHIKLSVYNLKGEEICVLLNEVKKPGDYKVIFDGSSLSSGVYLYRLETKSGFSLTRKMVLIK